MRTQKFQRIFDRVVRQLGRDPLARIPQDMSRAILEHVNERVETIYAAWDWPEWQVTEERAFRQIWNSSKQYKRVSTATGQPDEVFYLGAGYVTGGDFGTGSGYYKVLSTAATDPPVGTVPTNTTFWVPLSPVDDFIDYDQPCRRPIGRVLAVYASKPDPCCDCEGLRFRPSYRGLEVCGTGSATIFITYLLPQPVYTIIPFVDGRQYNRGDVVFDPDTGECFQAFETTTTPPNNATFWGWVPFLEKWATFVVQGTFADCLGEFDQGGNDDIQSKLVISQRAEGKANDALQARIDELTAQGQILKYSFCRRLCWCESLAFTGETDVVNL